MIKTLTKHGNSYALVVDKPILELIRATPDTRFEIFSDGRSLVLTPVRDPDDEKKFDKAVAMIHNRFGNAMRKLANLATATPVFPRMAGPSGGGAYAMPAEITAGFERGHCRISTIPELSAFCPRFLGGLPLRNEKGPKENDLKPFDFNEYRR